MTRTQTKTELLSLFGWPYIEVETAPLSTLKVPVGNSLEVTTLSPEERISVESQKRRDRLGNEVVSVIYHIQHTKTFGLQVEVDSVFFHLNKIHDLQFKYVVGREF